jgi:hypothetical protein
MADPQIPNLPAGAQVGQPVQADTPIQGLPPGAIVGAAVQQDTPAGQSSASGQPEQSGVGERLAQGAASGMAETLTGLGKIGSHIPGANWMAEKVGDVLGLPKLPEGTDPYKAVEKGTEHARQEATSTTAGKIGYGGEGLTEFLLGDEALKGLSIGDRLLHASQVAKVLEKFPRVMEAIQVGADAAKAHPVATKIIAEAARQGTVQGAQTLAKTGGDVGEAAKEGAEMAGTSGVLGAAGAGVGKVLKGAGKAAETVGTLGKVAEAAPSKEEVAESAKTAVDTAKQSMHNRFEAGINDLTERLGDKEIPHTDSPIATTAKELIKAPEPAEHGLVAAAKEAAGERIDKPVKALLDKAASQEGQAWKVNDLVDFRQAVRKLADSYEPGDPNARTLYKLLPAVDDTLGKLAETSGDKTAKADYAALRADYKDKIKYFTPSGKPEDKVAYAMTNVLRGGTKEDVGRYLLSGDSRSKVKALTGLLGDEGTKEIGKNVFGTLLEDASPNGKLNPTALVQKWTKLPTEAKNALFDSKIGDTAIQQLMQDAGTAAQVQRLTRMGLLAGIGGTFAHPVGAGIGTLLGLTMEGGGFEGGRKMLDYVANHPAVWKSLGLISKAGKVAELPGAATAGTVIKQQAGRGLANILNGASQPLAEENQ